MPAYPPVSSVSAAPIGSTVYAAAGHYTTASLTAVDVDATNAVVAFTAPASGRVRVMLSAFGDTTSTGVFHYWLLRDSGGTVAGTTQVVTRDANGCLLSMVIYKTGLTPGAAYSWKWGFYSNNASFSSRILQTSAFPPITMEVWAA